MERITEKLKNAINLQISREEESSRIYLAMSLFLDKMGWVNGAKLWKFYSDEELGHAKKFREYLLDRDVLPEVQALKEQKIPLECVTDVIAKSYEHEIQVSKWINELSYLALQEKDLTAYTFLQWFVNEQIEEEAKTLLWMDRVNIIKKTNSPLVMLEADFKKVLKHGKL